MMKVLVAAIPLLTPTRTFEAAMFSYTLRRAGASRGTSGEGSNLPITQFLQ